MYLLALVSTCVALAAAISDSEQRSAVRAAGNASTPLSPRGLFARQYNTCPSGSGLCDTGQCCEVGHACCGYEHCVPLDGSECCTDETYCSPPNRCYECKDDPGQVCCYNPADVEAYYGAVSSAVAAYGASVTAAVSNYNAQVSSVNAANSAKWASYTAAVASVNAENSAKYSSYTEAVSDYNAAVSSYNAAGGGYQYYYTTYWYYIIIWYTTTIATPELTSSSSSTSTVLSAYCSNSAEAQLSWSSMAQSVEAEVSYSAIVSSNALSSIPSATASYSYSGGGGSNGAGSMATARSGVLVYALPALGLVTGMLAVLL